MNTIFALGIPTLNRADLLNDALKKYVLDFPDTKIFIVDNGGQRIFEHENITMLRPLTNAGVARSWNMLCTEIFKLKIPNAIILNDDVYLGKKQDDVKNFISENGHRDLIATNQDWCVFVMPEKTFKKVGGFDEEFFPAYYEDNDFAYRMKLLGLSETTSNFLNPLVFRKSQTMAKDFSTVKDFDINKNRYIDKWGGLPEHEKYKTPFNKKTDEKKTGSTGTKK